MFISCPHCSHSFDLPADMAGKPVNCPHCEKAIAPSASSVASGEPPVKTADTAVTKSEAKPRPQWDAREEPQRHNIARKSSSLPILLIAGVAFAGLCVCAAPVVLVLGLVPVFHAEHRQVAVVAPRVEHAHGDAMEQVVEGPKRPAGQLKGAFDAREAIAKDMLLLKEYPPLPAPAWHGDYIKLLKERCNCEYLVIGEPNLPKDKVEEIHGWNATMQTELQRRFGANILADLRNEAEQRWRDRIKDAKK